MKKFKLMMALSFTLTLGFYPSVSILPLQHEARAASQQKEMTLEAVSGEGMSEQAATQDAFRNAIAQAVGVHVRSDTTVQEYITTSDKIRTSSRGFIKNFQKLSESTDADGVITVVMRVTVSTEPLEADLKNVVGLEFRNVGHPTVAVVGWFKGKDRAETEVNSIAVTALNRALINRGYKVVDAYQIAKLRAEDQALIQASGAATASNFDQLARKIAERVKADIYVTTFGSVEQGKASVATKMYNTTTGQIFGSETGYGSMPTATLTHAKAAVDQAITNSMKTVLNQVSNHWQDVLQNGREFIIVLEGIKTGKQRRDFKRLLSQADGVTEVKQQMVAGGRAEFSVYANTDPIDLFDMIIELAEAQGMRFINDEPVMRGDRAVFILR